MYAESGRLDDALKLATVAQEELKRPEAEDTLGWVYYRKGLAQHAIAAFERAVAKAPDNPVYQYHLGLAQMKDGNTRQGRAALKRALALKSDFNGADDARKALTRNRSASLPPELQRLGDVVGRRLRPIDRDPRSCARRAARGRGRARSAPGASVPASNMRRASASSVVRARSARPCSRALSIAVARASAAPRAPPTRARTAAEVSPPGRPAQLAGGQRRDRDRQVHPIAQRAGQPRRVARDLHRRAAARPRRRRRGSRTGRDSSRRSA